jgi:hypothetical protein
MAIEVRISLIGGWESITLSLFILIFNDNE